jgi:hypothetical protein
LRTLAPRHFSGVFALGPALASQHFSPVFVLDHLSPVFVFEYCLSIVRSIRGHNIFAAVGVGAIFRLRSVSNIVRSIGGHFHPCSPLAI